MTIHTFVPARPLAADGVELARAFQRAQVSKADVIHVTGPAAPTAMLWLGRNGYDQAILVRRESLASREGADVLLVPHACGGRELVELLGAGGGVREGGALIIQSAAFDAPEGESMLLESLGFKVEHRLSDRGWAVLIARRCGLGGFKSAA